MNTVESLSKAIVEDLKSLGDETQAEGARRYLKTSNLEFFGVKLPPIRKVAKEHSRNIDQEDFALFLRDLWKHKVFEVRRAAEEAMLQFIGRGMRENEAIPIISDWIDDIHTWALTDPLGWCVGQLLIRNVDLGSILRQWGKSGNRWRRRMAVVPYVDLCMKGQYRPEYGPMILEAVRPHIGDREFFVGKAVGWALRQLSYHEPDMVRMFIEENKDSMTRLVTREGSRKL